MVGPSLVFSLPANAEIILAGVALKGLLDPFLFIPAFPEMINYFRDLHPNTYFIGPVGDVMGSLGNVTIDISVLAATFFGHYAYTDLGYRKATDLFLFLQLPLIVLYFFFGGVIPEFKRKCSRKPPVAPAPATERPFNLDEEEANPEKKEAPESESP